MSAEEAFHVFLFGLTPHLQEHVGTHVQGDLEATMAMTQRLEVYRGGDGPRLVERRRDLEENSKSKTKRELFQWYRGMRQRKLSKWSSSSKRSRERARDARSRRRRETEEDSSRGSVSIVVETIPLGTARSGRR